MTFERHLPDEPLRPWVESILIVRAVEGLRNTLPPHTAPVLTYRLQGLTSVEFSDGERTIPRMGITGLNSGPRTILYHPGASMLLVRFREAGAAGLVPVPLDELAGTSQGLDDLMAPTAARDLEQRLDDAGDDVRKMQILQGFLKERLVRPDPLVRESIRRIRQARGNLRMADLWKDLPTNPDTLEKRFRRWVGTTPKLFARIVRFQSLVDAYSPGTRLTEAAVRAGFYDHAHMVREFQAFTGQTPSAYLGQPRRW